MKLNLTIILIVFCSAVCFGQKAAQKAEKAKSNAQQILLKKQILIDEIDNQARDVPIAAVRIFVRLKLAEWLWKDGADETGRAEQIAVRALEEFFRNSDELGELSYLSSDLFALLELNAKDTAKKLRAKYDVGSGEDLSNVSSLLDKKGGDKIVAEKIKKYIAEEQDLDYISFSMMALRNKKSPEFLAILNQIINLEEIGGNSFTADSLSDIVDDFRDASVPNDLKVRFYRIILRKARAALQSNEADDKQTADRLLYAVLADINTNAPELSAEANALRAALSSQNSQRARELEERYERIRESTDKISTTIDEAEKAEKGDKYNLYNQAARLATKEGKFQLAVDIYEKSIENLGEKDFPPLEFRHRYHDQQLREIVQSALGKNDAESAGYATKKIFDELSKSEALRRTAVYFYEKKDTSSALDAYDESLKLAEKADNGVMLKFYALTRLISVAQKLDPTNRISEVTKITAEAINRMPTLNPDDKAGTENFKKYVSLMMATNFNIYPAITALAKENKTEAADFSSRINRKEIRVVADLALAVNQIETEIKQLKTK